jgi:hypothetical protein
VKGLDAGVCGAELRLPQRHWSWRRLRAAASAGRRIASEQAAADLPGSAASREPSAGVAPMGASARSAIRSTPAAWSNSSSGMESPKFRSREGQITIASPWRIGRPSGPPGATTVEGADASWRRPCHL